MASRLTAVILSWLVTVVTAHATEYYVDADAGDGGVGTEAAPWTSLASLPTLQSGDVLNLAGHIREKLELVNVTDVTVRTWPGRSRAMIRGDRLVPTSGWSPTPGGAFQAQLDTGLNIWSVVWNWDSNLTVETPPREPRHFGHLRLLGSLAVVESTPGSWVYVPATGLLYVNPPEGVGAIDPDAGDVYSYCVDGNGIRMVNCVSCDLGNLDTALYCEFQGGRGYGVYVGGAGGGWYNTIHDMTIWDCGYHAVGILDGAGDGNVIRDVIARGQNAGPSSGSNPFVYYTNRDMTSGNRGENLVHHAYRLLDYAAQPIAAPALLFTLNTHTNGVARIADLEWRNITAIGYEADDQLMLSSASHTVDAADPADPETYAVRIYDARIRHSYIRQWVNNSSMAFIRTEFDTLEIAGNGPPPDTIILGNDAESVFESCLFKADRTGYATREIFNLAADAHLRLDGCTFYMVGSAGTMVTLADGARLSASQTVFSRGASGGLGEGVATTGVDELDLDRCWYHNIAGHSFFNGAATGGTDGVRTMADMQSNVDPMGIYGTDPQFQDAPSNLEGVGGGAIRETTSVIAGVDRLGFNQEPYGGHYGAYQYGACPGDTNDDGVVGIQDLLGIILQWGTCPGGGQACPADLTADGLVNVEDLLAVILGWGECP